MLKCANANRYRGLRYPKCNNGRPCKTCMAKWNAMQVKIAASEDSYNSPPDDFEFMGIEPSHGMSSITK